MAGWPRPRSPREAEQGQGTQEAPAPHTSLRSCFLLTSLGAMVAHDSHPSILASVVPPPQHSFQIWH